MVRFHEPMSEEAVAVHEARPRELVVGSEMDLARLGGLLQRFFDELDALEQPFVRGAVARCRNPVARTFVSAVNWLGNGWLYGVVLVALLAIEQTAGVRPALAGGLAIALSFAIYIPLKPLLGRLRPCEADSDLQTAGEPLDRFSCPSGHCMTASATAVVLALSFHSLALFVLPVGLLIAGARIACGHHYPSDVVLGTLLGVAIAWPVCLLVL